MEELVYTKTFENKRILKNILIPTTNNWKSTEEKNLSILESGEKGVLFDRIINDINSAQKMICLQSFLIQDTKIIDALLKAKREREVRIFIMDSAEARLNDARFEEDESFATKDYKKMLDEKFKYNFVHRQANNLHAKYILIDTTNNPKGYIFTGNFNEKPFFENPELAVPLSKTQVEELFKVFVYHFWEFTSDEQSEKNSFDKIKPINKFKQPKLNNILLTSPNTKLSNLKSTLIDAINKAKTNISLSTFGFDINNQVSQNILEKLKSGVKVTVFCRPREKSIINNIEELAKNGAIIICHPLIHAKSLLIDNKEGYIFSANFEDHGLNEGFEVGIKLNEKQVNDLIEIMKNWNNTFPFKYENSITIREIDTFHELNDINIKKNTTQEEIQNKQNVAKNTNDLIRIIDIKEPQNSLAKKIIFNISIKLEKFNKQIKAEDKIYKGVYLIEYGLKNKKQTTTERAILIDKSLIILKQELVSVIEKYKNIKIFSK